MATISFTRTIIITDKNAIKKIRKESKLPEQVIIPNRNRPSQSLIDLILSRD